MNTLSFFTLGAANANGGYQGIILIVLMIALMYFFMIRPQQKQRKQHQDMMSKLHKGDEVVTIGRLHGVIYSINESDKTVVLDCDGIYLEFDMVAIARVVNRAEDDKQEAPKEEAKSEEKPAENDEESASDDAK
ncbi:MAG: preprotein translocase subunit YajC [Limosilactobacillus sp.]|uniref:preprotein translocase subunit YajC n=1 Tax=Limosilactobacillus sp. TaxID=2773925 RepID=UPI0026F81EFD|nr:preprotein translocase subunit YajC [Limosilactobacillus sp.]